MTAKQLKELIKRKSLQFEEALSTQTPHTELMKAYKELKDLQCQLIYTEIEERTREYI